MKIDRKNIVLVVITAFVAILFGRYWAVSDMSSYHKQMMHNHMEMLGSGGEGLSESSSYLIAIKDHMIGEMVNNEQYKCCLEKPCTYCLTENKKEDESIGCDCLEEVMNGEHPCGECIGEILEGHGNRFVAKYFARALADELGESHLSEIQKIIEEKYKVPVSDQV